MPRTRLVPRLPASHLSDRGTAAALLSTHHGLIRYVAWLTLGIVALLSALATTAHADDRELLRDRSADPYVFVVMDTSGSMHWTPPCDEDDARSDIDPWDGFCTSECPFDDPTCARVCPSNGCVDYAEDASATTPIEVIIDNRDAGSVTLTGDWDPATNGAYEEDYLFLNAGEQGSARFATTLPEAGDYHVYGWWQRRSHRSENVRFTIDSVAGSQYLEIDQSDNTFDAQFVYLGTFEFDDATPAVVTISNTDDGNDGGSASADAIRFSRLPPPATMTCNATGYRCQQPLCPKGDCQAPLGADDPTSKFFQARQAIYEVLEQVPNVNFGFGSFEQDNFALLYKHYLYKVRETNLLGADTPEFNDKITDAAKKLSFTWPVVGTHEVIGTGGPYNNNGRSEDNGFFHCSTTTLNPGDNGYDDDHEIGCTAQTPADINDIWEIDRFRRIPKLGRDGVADTRLFIRDADSNVYRIDYENNVNPLAAIYGADTISVDMDLRLCTNANCSNAEQLVDNMTVTLDLVSEFGEYQGGTERYPQNAGGWFANQSAVNAGNTCNGLEPNDDYDANSDDYDVAHSDDDAYFTLAAKLPRREDPRGAAGIDGTVLDPRVNFHDRGDFIPLDWERSNNEELRWRLAPNAWQLSVGGVLTNSLIELESTGDTPDFRSAVYFDDALNDYNGNSNSRRHDLKDSFERPLMAQGSTPLAASLEDFRDWYTGGVDCNPTGDVPCGWQSYAEVFDLNWTCKKKFVLMITDGDETCDSVADACAIAGTLLDSHQVRTFVVGFGLAEGADALTCMAREGGTGLPIYPRNKEDLVNELLDVFDQVKAESRAFASASIPAVQATTAATILLSSFTPAAQESLWPGRIDIFRQPLPLDDQRRPLLTRTCGGDIQEACHLYDVANKMVEQAPEIDMTGFDLGAGDLADLPSFYKMKVGRDDAATTDDNEENQISIVNRRVLYGQSNPTRERPGPLRLMWPPHVDSTYDGASFDRLDMADVLIDDVGRANYYACDPGVDDCSQQESNLDDALQEVVARFARVKTVSLKDAEDNEIACTGNPDLAANKPCRYVMGDVFHANPQVVGSPGDFNFFQQDLCGRPEGDRSNNCVPPENFSSAAEMSDRGYRAFVQRNVWRRRMLATATNDGQLHFIDTGKYISIDDPVLGTTEVFTDGTGHEMFSYMPRMLMPVVREQVNGENHIYSMDGTPVIGDAFVDPVPDEAGDYNVADREWRTMVVGGLREGGSVFDDFQDVPDFESGYYALDITTPDQMEPARDAEDNILEFAPWVPVNPGKFLPDCFGIDDDSGAQIAVDADGCKTQAGEAVPFPMEMWTFQDTVEVNSTRYFLDEDRNDYRDLGDTWSKPVIVQIEIGGGETKWVAMFGGGLDPENINNPERGEYFYMVDIETGNAIYKRRVNGAIPSDPAAVDIDGDGIVERVYFGTTSGRLYKIDLEQLEPDDELPTLEEVRIRDNRVLGWTAGPGEDDRVAVERITSSAWDPFVIFRNNAPIYYAPAAFNIPQRDQWGLAFGVGAREDLWEESGFDGGFYVIVDEDYEDGDVDLPIREDDLIQYDWLETDPITGEDELGDVQFSDNLLLLQRGVDQSFLPGWSMRFPADFKTTAEPFVLSGILIFSSFDPLTISIENPDPDSDAVCAQTGTTYTYILSVLNGQALAPRPGCGGRCEVIDEFTTAIHTDRRDDSPADPVDGEPGSQVGGLGDETGDETDEALANALRDAVLGFAPRSCQFNENYEIIVSALRNSTGVNVYARIPMLVCPGDWTQ